MLARLIDRLGDLLFGPFVVLPPRCVIDEIVRRESRAEALAMQIDWEREQRFPVETPVYYRLCFCGAPAALWRGDRQCWPGADRSPPAAGKIVRYYCERHVDYLADVRLLASWYGEAAFLLRPEIEWRPIGTFVNRES